MWEFPHFEINISILVESFESILSITLNSISLLYRKQQNDMLNVDFLHHKNCHGQQPLSNEYHYHIHKREI